LVKHYLYWATQPLAQNEKRIIQSHEKFFTPPEEKSFINKTKDKNPTVSYIQACTFIFPALVSPMLSKLGA